MLNQTQKSDLSYENIVTLEQQDVSEIVAESKEVKSSPVTERSCESSHKSELKSTYQSPEQFIQDYEEKKLNNRVFEYN